MNRQRKTPAGSPAFTKEHHMSKPLNENIRALRIETETGDLVPLLDHAGRLAIAPLHHGRRASQPHSRMAATSPGLTMTYLSSAAER